LRNLPTIEIPSDWEVHCYPGATFATLAGALDRWQSHVPTLMLSVGINDRRARPEKASDDFDLLIDKAKGKCTRLVFQPIQFSNRLNTMEQKNLNALMETVTDSVTLTPRIVGFKTKRDDHIHWDSGTCKIFVANLISFLKN
jgi:hypothetical protein